GTSPRSWRPVSPSGDIWRRSAPRLVGRLPAHGRGKVLRIAEFGGAGGDEQLRYFLGVHVFLDRRVRRRAQRAEPPQHLVAVDQHARLLDSLRRAVAVVVADENYLAAFDAAVRVY